MRKIGLFLAIVSVGLVACSSNRIAEPILHDMNQSSQSSIVNLNVKSWQKYEYEDANLNFHFLLPQDWKVISTEPSLDDEILNIHSEMLVNCMKTNNSPDASLCQTEIHNPVIRIYKTKYVDYEKLNPETQLYDYNNYQKKKIGILDVFAYSGSVFPYIGKTFHVNAPDKTSGVEFIIPKLGTADQLVISEKILGTFEF